MSLSAGTCPASAPAGRRASCSGLPEGSGCPVVRPERMIHPFGQAGAPARERCTGSNRTDDEPPVRFGAPAGSAGALLPRDGAERAVMLALRYVAAAAETGDAACFDAAFDGAEAAFGPRDGALLVARAAALVRAIRRDGDGARFLPPPCRRLSAGEAHLLAALRSRLSGRSGTCPAGLSGSARAALADLAASISSAGLGLQLLPSPGRFGEAAV